MRILVVEDDEVVARWVRRLFEEDGHTVYAAATGEAALAEAGAREYDLVLVDLGLPGRDGLTVVESLRRAGRRMPILIVSGRGGDDDVARGLDAGADDYLTKPVSATVLRARARAALRRAAPAAGEELSVGTLRLSRTTCRARGPLGEVELTAKEFALLEFLLSHAGQVTARATLLEKVWGYDFDPGTNVVEVALSRLRQKLAEVDDGVVLRTVRGLGVVLQPRADER